MASILLFGCGHVQASVSSCYSTHLASAVVHAAHAYICSPRRVYLTFAVALPLPPVTLIFVFHAFCLWHVCLLCQFGSSDVSCNNANPLDIVAPLSLHESYGLLWRSTLILVWFVLQGMLPDLM